MALTQIRSRTRRNNSPHDVSRALLRGRGATAFSVRGVTTAQVHYAALGFQDWLRRTPEIEQARWAIDAKRDPANPEADDGVIRRLSDKPSDQKTFLHVRNDLLERLEASDVTVDEPWRSWIAGCAILRNACVAAAELIAKAIDNESPGMRCLERLIEAEMGNRPATLRVLSYAPGDRGFAKPHVDRNGFTFALGESDPCLYFSHPSGEKYQLRDSHDGGIVFAGAQLEKASNGRIKAQVHGSDSCDSAHSRWAVVGFVYLAD